MNESLDCLGQCVLRDSEAMASYLIKRCKGMRSYKSSIVLMGVERRTGVIRVAARRLSLSRAVCLLGKRVM